MDIKGWFGSNFDDEEVLACNYEIHKTEIEDSIARMIKRYAAIEQ